MEVCFSSSAFDKGSQSGKVLSDYEPGELVLQKPPLRKLISSLAAAKRRPTRTAQQKWNQTVTDGLQPVVNL